VGAAGIIGDGDAGDGRLPGAGSPGLAVLASGYGMLVLLDGIGRDGGMIAGFAAGAMLDGWLVAPKASRELDGMLPDDIGEPLVGLPKPLPVLVLLGVEPPKLELLLDRLILPPELLAPLP
jgi:hypothetical protein